VEVPSSKYLTKIGVQQSRKSKPKTTARQQSVIKATLKVLTQNFLSVKSIYKCVIVDDFFFTVEGNAWPKQSYHESEDHPTAHRKKS
jgi:hypothetical protein